jgi:hypothetical protein
VSTAPSCEWRPRTLLDTDANTPPCGRRDVYAFTNPGSLSIQLCRNFRKLAWRNAGYAANLLIHEMLHSLGTGEAPQTGELNGYEITARVESQCGW